MTIIILFSNLTTFKFKKLKLVYTLCTLLKNNFLFNIK